MTIIFQNWLNSTDQFKCVLVHANAKVDSIEQEFHFSSRPYQDYLPLINDDSIVINEKLSLSGGSGLSVGDIELQNADGSIDEYLTYIWASRSCKIYFGDVRWQKVDFQLIFDGVTDDIDSRDRDSINIRIRDKLQRLDSPLIETVLGGNTTNKSSLIPLTFGEVHNITPLLTDSALLKYQVHDSKIESIIEVRDAGVPVGFVANVNAGTFTLNASPFYAVTCSAQGDKQTVWNIDVPSVITRLVTAYGHSSTRFSNTDIDSNNFNNFANINPQSIGIYIDSSDTVLNACQQIAASVGGQIVMSREGKLQLKKIDFTPSNQIEINNDDIIASSLKVNQKIKVQGSFKVGFAKNYTIQESLDTRIPPSHKDLFAKEWLEVSSTDETVKTDYKQLNEVERIDTLLLTESDAQDLSNFYLDLYSSPRFIYSLQVIPRFMNIELGQSVKLVSNRFGLDTGKDGQVIGISTNWGNGTVNLEVLI